MTLSHCFEIGISCSLLVFASPVNGFGLEVIGFRITYGFDQNLRGTAGPVRHTDFIFDAVIPPGL